MKGLGGLTALVCFLVEMGWTKKAGVEKIDCFTASFSSLGGIPGEVPGSLWKYDKICLFKPLEWQCTQFELLGTMSHGSHFPTRHLGLSNNLRVHMLLSVFPPLRQL